MPFDLSKENDFFISVFQGNVETVLDYLETHGTDILSTQSATTNLNPTELAAYCGHNALIDLFFGIDENVLEQGADGISPLHIAALGGQNNTIHHLINHYHLSPRVQDSLGALPIHYAAKGGFFDTIVQFNHEHGNEYNVKTKIFSDILHYAAMGGHNDLIDCLALPPCKMDPKRKFENGLTALHCAAENGHHHTLEHLVNVYGVDINTTRINGLAPIHYAIKSNRLSTVEFIINTFKINPFEEYKKYSILQAAQKFNCEGMTLLFEAVNEFYLALKDANYQTVAEVLESAGLEHKQRMLQWPIFENGTTAFEFACNKGLVNFATLIANHDKNIIEKTKSNCFKIVESKVLSEDAEEEKEEEEEGEEEEEEEEVEASDVLEQTHEFDTFTVTFWHVCARMNDLVGLQMSVYFTTIFQNVLSGANTEGPYQHLDQDLILRGLIGGSYKADSKPGCMQDLNMENITLGIPNTEQEKEASKELAYLYATALDEKDTAAHLAESLSLTGRGFNEVFKSNLTPDQVNLVAFAHSRSRAKTIRNYQERLLELESQLETLTIKHDSVIKNIFTPHAQERLNPGFNGGEGSSQQLSLPTRKPSHRRFASVG